MMMAHDTKAIWSVFIVESGRMIQPTGFQNPPELRPEHRAALPLVSGKPTGICDDGVAGIAQVPRYIRPAGRIDVQTGYRGHVWGGNAFRQKAWFRQYKFAVDPYEASVP